MSIIKGARNLDNAKSWYDWALTPAAQVLGGADQAVPGAVEQEHADPAAGAEARRDQADQLRFRQVRLVRGAPPPAREVGQRGEEPAEVAAIDPGARRERGPRPAGSRSAGSATPCCPGTSRAACCGRLDGSAPAGGSALALALPGRAPGGCCRSLLPLLAATRPLVRRVGSRERAAAGSSRRGGRARARRRCRASRSGSTAGTPPGWPPSSASPGPRQAGMGFGAALTSVAVPDAALPRARGARLVPGRRLRRLVDRPRRRADRRLRVLSRHDASSRAPSGTMPAPSRPARSLTKFLDPSIWSLDCLTSNLRCGVAWNTLFLGDARRHRHDGARPRLRADRHAHGFPLQARPARPDGAADHHAALRDRARADPAVRPLRRPLGPALRSGSACRARAGSTACRASSSRSSSPSRRSPSWC